MMTIASRAIRPIPIMRVWATGRVPFGLRPVTAATAAMITARPSQTSQFMTRSRYKIRATGFMVVSTVTRWYVEP